LAARITAASCYWASPNGEDVSRSRAWWTRSRPSTTLRLRSGQALVSGLRETLNVPIGAQVEPLVVNVGGEERVLLSTSIPEAIAYQKPVYIRSQGLDKGCYKRVGGHDMP